MYKNMFSQSLNGSMGDLVEEDDSGTSSGSKNKSKIAQPVNIQLASNIQSLSQSGSEGQIPSSKLKFVSTVR